MSAPALPLESFSSTLHVARTAHREHASSPRQQCHFRDVPYLLSLSTQEHRLISSASSARYMQLCRDLHVFNRKRTFVCESSVDIRDKTIIRHWRPPAELWSFHNFPLGVHHNVLLSRNIDQTRSAIVCEWIDLVKSIAATVCVLRPMTCVVCVDNEWMGALSPCCLHSGASSVDCITREICNPQWNWHEHFILMLIFSLTDQFNANSPLINRTTTISLE